MPVRFPSLPANFVGRDDYISRFAARLEHFHFFLYGGIAGVGKTWLILRLAKETRALGLRGALYLPIWPGESIQSIVARVEAAGGKARATATERQGDPYARLAEHLESRKLALLLDDVHCLRREDLLSLLRAVRINPGNYRVIAAGSGEPDLSAIDRMEIHHERVGSLNAEETLKLANAAGVKGEAAAALAADAARGGCAGHPLTLRYLLALHGANLPPPEFFASQSSRSINAFRALLHQAGDRFAKQEREVLGALARVGVSLSKTAALKAFGPTVTSLLKRGMLVLLNDDVFVHELLSVALSEEDRQLSEAAAKSVAKHLVARGLSDNEPLRILRAAELLSRVGANAAAVDTLTAGWDAAREFGFLEAYLKSVAAIQTTPALAPRLRLLSAQARMRQGNVAAVREELEHLAGERDQWTRARALTALTYVYGQLSMHEQVATTFASLRRGAVSAELLLPAGVLAAASMLRIGRIPDAEKLSRDLLTRVKGKALFEREGELRRLLARVYAQSGRLNDAVREAQAAAKAFTSSGNLYQAATAHGFVGDVYRETGDFEAAKSAFARYHDTAAKWGDRDLLQVAELAEAWVSLDMGDLTHAARQIAAVEKEMGAAPSRRLKRYLAAARALLEAGRGRHKSAAMALERVVEAWESAGQRSVADTLRAQEVRSLIASNELERARAIVDQALSRLDPKIETPRAATFLRESALIRLRHKEVKQAMAELAQARRLFAKSGNRREEALTLYRIAHAALEDGDVALAASSTNEALALGRKIKHPRVIALCREIQGRIALIHDDAKAAVACGKESLQALRRLGDELGSLHVSESLLRALIAAGDLAGAIRLGPKVSDQAERLEIREVRVRAIVLTGVALLRRGRVEAATRCFRELPDQALGPLTGALMWRLGEAIASVAGPQSAVLERRAAWVSALRRMPETQQAIARHFLQQLELPPQERCSLRTAGAASRTVKTEEIAWIEPEQFDLFVDVQNKRLYHSGAPVEIPDPELHKLFNRLVIAAPKPVSNEALSRALFGAEGAAPQEATEDREKKVKASVKQLQSTLRGARHISIVSENGGIKLVPPTSFAFVVPRAAELPNLRPSQKKILRMLRRYGTLPLNTIQNDCNLSRSAARRELGDLVRSGLVRTVRDGRGQAFRLV